MKQGAPPLDSLVVAVSKKQSQKPKKESAPKTMFTLSQSSKRRNLSPELRYLKIEIFLI